MQYQIIIPKVVHICIFAFSNIFPEKVNLFQMSNLMYKMLLMLKKDCCCVSHFMYII